MSTKTKRKRYPMPDDVREALERQSLMQAYLARPAYQQNDYLWWITGAKREETKRKRLNQMLEELEKGGVYMNMAHPSSSKEQTAN